MFLPWYDDFPLFNPLFGDKAIKGYRPNTPFEQSLGITSFYLFLLDIKARQGKL